MSKDPHQITLTLSFDDNGKLKDVIPEDKAKVIPLGGPGDPIPLKKFEHEKGRIFTFIYEYGSPGSITIEMESGPIRITWPQ